MPRWPIPRASCGAGVHGVRGSGLVVVELLEHLLHVGELLLGLLDRLVRAELRILSDVQLCVWSETRTKASEDVRTPKLFLFRARRVLDLPSLDDILPKNISNLPHQRDLLLELLRLNVGTVRQDLVADFQTECCSSVVSEPHLIRTH